MSYDLIASMLSGGAIVTIVQVILNYFLKRKEISVSVENFYLQNLEERMKKQNEHIDDCNKDKNLLRHELNLAKDLIAETERKQSTAQIIIDSEGMIIDWSMGATLLFYYTREEIIGRPAILLMPDRYQNLFTKALQNAIISKKEPDKAPKRFSAVTRNGAEIRVVILLSSYTSHDCRFFIAEIRLSDTKYDSDIILETLK